MTNKVIVSLLNRGGYKVKDGTKFPVTVHGTINRDAPLLVDVNRRELVKAGFLIEDGTKSCDFFIHNEIDLPCEALIVEFVQEG